jgi:hypothetical protein
VKNGGRSNCRAPARGPAVHGGLAALLALLLPLSAPLASAQTPKPAATPSTPAAAPQAPPVPPDMVDPAIDSAGPFTYFSKPTDEIGVMDGRGTEVTPEGYLYTGYGELMFLAGPTLRPVQQRIRTLRDGWMPVIGYEVRRGDVAYDFTLFAATLDGRPDSPVVDFVRVVVRNTGPSNALGRVAFAVRYTGPATTGNGVADNRFRRPVAAQREGAYDQPGVAFDSSWTYGFGSGAFVRGGKVFYLFPTEPAPELRLTRASEGSRADSIAPVRLRVQQTTPVGVAVYDLVLGPGESRALVVKLPYAPVAPDDPWLARLRTADFDATLSRTEAFWRGMIGRGMRVHVAEPKVVDTFRASLVYDLLARDKIGDDYVQTVNELHYHAFWLRDASYIVRAYDVTGYPDIAAQTLRFFARWQQPDGNFVSQGGQFDGWGQTLWAYGQHFRLTGDTAFADRVLPAVVKAVAWLHAARAGDSLHLVPSTSPGDNEDISGHVTGHDFWALAGLHGAISLAEGARSRADATTFRREYASLERTLVRRLRRVTKTTGGYIPPGLDVKGGQDWGNMMAVYPEQVLDPHDPMVTATLDSTRAKYAEGIMTYGDGQWLHDYLTMKNTETEVVRGDQQLALQELYAVLVHTSATQAGFEFSIRPWGNRDFGFNLSPHGWFAAKYRALLRDMLVREQGDELHLMSVVSPAWLADGDSIVVRDAPTEFGKVGYALQVGGTAGLERREGNGGLELRGLSFGSADGGLNGGTVGREDDDGTGKRGSGWGQVAGTQAVLRLDAHFTRAPRAIVLHVPWFMDVSRATADGREVRVRNGVLRLSPSTRVVRLEWTRRDATPDMSYASAVREYREEYRDRWEAWVRGTPR